jgi:hypothetical protein
MDNLEIQLKSSLEEEQLRGLVESDPGASETTSFFSQKVAPPDPLPVATDVLQPARPVSLDHLPPPEDL